MLIDWFTVLAQIVNFLVLVALMKRFLYGPLIAAIDAREASIAGRLAEAGRTVSEAEALKEQLARDAEKMESDKAGALAKAREDADRQRGEILARAREDIKTLEAKWHGELARDRAAFLDDVRRRAAVEILAAARSALRDLACADVQRSAVSAFVEKLGAVDLTLLRSLAAHGIAVVSHEELPPEVRTAVRDAIGARLGDGTAIAFEVAPAMAWGVELRGDGQRIGWTPDAYLDSLDDRMRLALDKAAAN